MAFQLNIRQNTDTAADHFGSGTVRDFVQTPVRIGRAAPCECPVDSPEFAPVHATIRVTPAGTAAWLHPEPGQPLFLNQDPVGEPHELRSGDVIRIGHWTLRFHRLHPATRHSWRADALATVAKVLVAVILLGELSVASWLPRRLRAATLWEAQVAIQRTTMLADHLRGVNATARPETELERAARAVIAAELDRLVRVMRQGDRLLTAAQWATMFEDLEEIQTAMGRLDEGTAWQRIPVVDVDAGVRGALNVSPQSGVDR